MIEVKNSSLSKHLSMLLAFSILIGMVPPVFVNAVPVTESFATIETLVDGGTVEGNNVTFSGCKLNWFPKDDSIGRWTDGWWVGIKVIAPADVNLETATYQNKTSDGWGVAKSFKNYRDSDDSSESQFITLWGVVNEAYLNDALINGKEYLEYGYQFDWNGDGTYEQPISMRVVPDKIVLMNKNGSQEYPKSTGLADVDAITNGITVSGNGGSIITVENTSALELHWVAADTGIGRTEDGWWIGYTVTAPEGFSVDASYQHKTSSGWGDANSFEAHKDTENSIQVWRLVNEEYLSNAAANQKAVNYITRYDWDGDGVYEQVIRLKINPVNITLIANNGEQVYPYFGTVIPLTGGTVSGNTSNLELVIDEANLNWSAKDESIGRYYDGWWVGMRVTAPEGYTAEQLKNAKYKTRVTRSGGTAWSDYADKSFWTNKDSADRDATHYIGMWLLINPELLAAYKNNRNNIKSEYVFDWDGDGTDDQTITMTVDPDGNIVLNKVAQTGFGFVEPNPVDKWVGEPYTNTASGGQGTGAVTYAIISGGDIADIDADTGLLTFKKVGTVQVMATKAADDTYAQTTATYTVKAIKYPQSEFRFENSNSSITVGFAVGSFTNSAFGGSGDGAIKYSIVSGDSIAAINEITGEVTFYKAGEVTVSAKKEADDKYTETTVTYTLIIEKSAQAALVFAPAAPSSITYRTEAQNIISVTGGSGEGKITYSIISGNEYAVIDENTGAVKTLKAGGSFTVQADKAGDDGYDAAAPITVTIYVDYAEQTDFAFAQADPKNITFNDNNNEFSNTASGGESTGTVTYAFADAESAKIAEIDAQSGEITIFAAGTVTVVATKAGDDCYKEAKARYSLTVERDMPEFSVDDVSLIYGVREYQVTVNTVFGSSDYLYSIVGTNNIGASIDKNGKISFENSTGKVGSIIIEVWSEEDSCYLKCEKTFTLTVSYHEPTAQPIVSGSSKNDSGWYTGTVTITAPDGYTISYANDLDGVMWSDAVTVNADGNNSKDVYLKIGDEISGAISFDSIKIDTAAPANLAIQYDNSFIEKVLSSITFGIYKADTVSVTLSASDMTSGVDHFTYNVGEGDVVVPKSDFTKNENGVAEYTFVISAQFRNKVKMSATDVAGWTSESTETGHTLVIDSVSPKLTFGYNFTGSANLGDVIYTNGDVTVQFEIEEDNFDLRTVDPVFMVGSMKIALTWEEDTDAGVWKAKQLLSGDNVYDLSLTFTDASGNKMDSYVKTIIIDSDKPVISCNYGNAVPIKDNIFNQPRTAEFTVIERYFNAENVILNITAEDITGAPVDISSKAYAEYVKSPANWSQNGDVWTLNPDGMKFDIDAIYSITLSYTDLAENEATPYTADFVVDKTAPSDIKIEYSKSIVDQILETITFGFYRSEVTVTVTALDSTAGVEFFKITYTKQEGASDINRNSYTTGELAAIQDTTDGKVFTVTHTIPANARGTVSVDLIDKAGNGNSAANPVVLVVDQVNPTREVIYTPYKILDAATMLEVQEYKEGDNAILYYNRDSATVTFRITEANFDHSLNRDDTKPIIQVNGVRVNVDWTNDGDIWTATYTINGDGDYYVTMTYTDLSTNEMKPYQSCKLVIDSKPPVIKAEYTDGTPNQIIDGRKYYRSTQTVLITVTEHNFRADDVVLTVTAKDIQGNDIDISSKGYADYAKDRNNWTHDGDVHTLKTEGMVFDIDAIYTFHIAYDDILDNSAADVADDFVIDHREPENLRIEYSKSIVDKIIETITFGFYQPEVIVTVTADDITSGVDYFDWTYTKEEESADENANGFGARISSDNIEYSNSGLSAKATFTVPANARGYITVTATDRSGNITTQTDKDRITVVVDNIAPTVSVRYVADNADTRVQFTDEKSVTVNAFADAAHAYYNGNVTAKILIHEANFFEGVKASDGVIHNVGIKLTVTDDDGNSTVYEYLPTGAAQKYNGAVPKYITWAASGNDYSFNINYADNADYVLEIEYTDLSANDASISANDGSVAVQSYMSKVVTVDKIAPVVDVKYSNDRVIHTIDGRNYFDAEQTATITVKEHNFRADDFVASVTAKDILGADVKVEDFRATLSDDTKWLRNGNTYTITLTYATDANYSFDFVYKDLAQNSAAAYDEDFFTVDKTAPKNLTVSYSQSITDRILETITFGYYNAKVTVAITAEDDTSGIHRFEYAYLKEKGVSAVNAELLKTAIEEASFTVSGNKSIATFEIPKDVLRSDNQFNGTVEFTAFDRAENNTGLADNRRIIVDNIAPTATITYNEPVQKTNDISYYAGNIDAIIVINEANFYSEDVVVMVNDRVIAVKWVDNSVDLHTGTFTLTEDGDYVVTVEYKDRSDNAMVKYTSNRLTLDTKTPTVTVTNIRQNSANKDEKYGFTITADDINLDASSFTPVLTATVRKEDGSYGTKTVSLGEMRTVEAGKTYAFTVDNLEVDAVYSLVCTLKDMSGNAYSKIVLSDGAEYEEVRFSINRNGSTFAVDKNTDTLVERYYVYSVDENVEIEEVNVDPVETYTVKLNGKVLIEGTDYTTSLTDNAGEWSKRTYTISKEIFGSEGEYSIVVESKDKADTTAYSDVKNLSVLFVVDRTAPILTISGLENGGRYQVEEQTVTVIPTDDGGRLYSMKVVVLNSDGEPLKDANGKDISVRFEMSGEEFLTYLTEHNGKVTFTVPEGLENQVQIICNDCAVNADGTTNEYNETFTKVTVSQSGWIIFYANKPLFYGSVAGALLLVGGIIFLIFFKKRR